MKIIIALILIVVTGVLSIAQTPEVIGIEHNPALLNRSSALTKSSVVFELDTLPFFDDFSYYRRSPLPYRERWIDNNVFINNIFPVQPRSNGVATFDALDSDGKVYENTAPSFIADVLTSVPINLEEQSDVWLSFYYQPQGFGDNPEPGDSLILQFKEPDTDRWRNVWSVPGTTLHPFTQVTVSIDDIGDGIFLYKGFQFRFMNIVSLEQDRFNPGKRSGNVDHWHLDYVLVHTDRDTHTSMQDVAIVAPMKSLIRGYKSIPLNQLSHAITTRLEPMIEITYRNNGNRTQIVSEIIFSSTNVYNNVTTNSRLRAEHDEIEADEIFTLRQNIFNPFHSLNTNAASPDSALFELKGHIVTHDDYNFLKLNDTVHFNQFFGDYFARDDGTPESGYGFIGFNAQGCAIACRYESFVPGHAKLNAIEIYFNPTFTEPTSAPYRFRVAVWEDNNGQPGNRLYVSSDEYRLEPELTGRFVRFGLDKPEFVGRNYWIGIVQVTSGFLNIGYDLNYNDRGNLWYNNGTWNEDINNGTLMIRPVFCQAAIITSSELANPAVPDIKLYPNPASHHVNVEINDALHNYHIEIFDSTGRILYQTANHSKNIDVSAFASGIYFVRIVDKNTGKMQTEKLIIER